MSTVENMPHLQLVLDSIPHYVGADSALPPDQRVGISVLNRLCTHWAEPVPGGKQPQQNGKAGPVTTVPGLHQYLYEKAVPLCFTIPSKTNFDWGDAASYSASRVIIRLMTALMDRCVVQTSYRKCRRSSRTLSTFVATSSRRSWSASTCLLSARHRSPPRRSCRRSSPLPSELIFPPRLAFCTDGRAKRQTIAQAARRLSAQDERPRQVLYLEPRAPRRSIGTSITAKLLGRRLSIQQNTNRAPLGPVAVDRSRYLVIAHTTHLLDA